MTGDIDRHPGAHIHHFFHHFAIGSRVLAEGFHPGVKHNWQGLRVVINMLGQGLMNFHQMNAVWLNRRLNWRVDDVYLRAWRNLIEKCFNVVITQANTA